MMGVEMSTFMVRPPLKNHQAVAPQRTALLTTAGKYDKDFEENWGKMALPLVRSHDHNCIRKSFVDNISTPLDQSERQLATSLTMT